MHIPVYKTCELELKDVDTTQGIVSGYFSAFDNVDYHKDVILKGAYHKSISERGPKTNRDSKIHHLLEHDTEKPVGKLLSLEEDARGLLFESKISKTKLGQDTLIRYQEKIYSEHSVGIYIDPKKTDKDKNGNRIIKEAMLVEGSTVLMGANDQTPVVGIKSYFSNPEKLIQKKERIAAYLKSGKTGTDELFLSLEKELQFYTQLLTELKALKETTQPTMITEPDADAIAKSISKIIIGNYN